jgi:hypothetical protein
MAAASWDPLTGNIAAAGGSRLDLDLAPYESRVIVFSKNREPARPADSGPPPASIELNGKWTIAFAGDAQPVSTVSPHSWTDDGAHKFFSGHATYETTVSVPQAVAARHAIYVSFGEGTPVAIAERNSGSGMRAMLEGPVREAAVVYINGKRAGSIWCAPYEISVAGLLHAGENQVRIVVANLAINQLAAGPLPDYKALNARYGERFQPQDMAHLEPQPSGILATVRLIAR